MKDYPIIKIEPELTRASVYLFMAFILVMIGCNPINKAKQTVLTNEQAFNEVGAKWAKLNPCNTDSPSVIYIEGKETGVTTPSAADDQIQKAIDSVMAVFSGSNDISAALASSYNYGYEDAVRHFKSLPPRIRVDTFKIKLPPDTRAMDMLQTKLNSTAASNNGLAASLESANKQLKKYESWLFYCAIASVLLGIVIGKLLPALSVPKLFGKK